MVPLSSLWLPILVSAVFVFIASNVLWMALPFWHRKAIEMCGAKNVRVTETKCRAKGAELCEYVCEWE